MPIQEDNIVFLESRVMDDVPEGGGGPSGNVIPDGQMNNVYPDISDLDRTLGRFNLRQLHLAVRSLDTDLYGGAKLAITALPEDEAIGYTLFRTSDAFHTRDEAIDRVEAYLYKGPMWHGALQANHIAGMAAINVIQRPDTALPPVGKTLCLVQYEGEANEIEQYVRVNSVTVTPTTFGSGDSEFERWIVRLDLSDPLRHDFAGHAANPNDTYDYTVRARLRDTVVANATRYYSSHRLSEPAVVGDLSVRATSQFVPLVPAARTETPLVSQPMNPELVQTLSAGSRTVEVPQQAHTVMMGVTAENRRLNWIRTVSPRPAPGTLLVSYVAQGNWYTLTDDGSGVLSGTDPGFGAGTVDYATGDVLVTLGALPDAGTQIMLVWASPAHYAVRVGDPDIDPSITLTHNLEDCLKPGTLVLTWLQDGLTKTAQSDQYGEIAGDAIGNVNHATGEFWLQLDTPPDYNSQIGVDYERQLREYRLFEGVAAPGGLATVDVGESIVPGSLYCEWSVVRKNGTSNQSSRHSYSKTNGSWVMRRHSSSSSSSGSSSDLVRRVMVTSADGGAGEIRSAEGVVDYAGGQITIPVLPDVLSSSYSSGSSSESANSWGGDNYGGESGGGWEQHTSSSESWSFEPGIIHCWYTRQSTAPESVSVNLPLPALTFGVLPRLLDEAVVPNSVEFTWAGDTYRDYNGTLVRNPDAQGSGVVAGAIDYSAGEVTLDLWGSGGGAVNVTSLLTRYGDWMANEAMFRAAIAPLVPEGLGVVAVTGDGEQITGQFNSDGDLVGDLMRGRVDYEFGIAYLQFGEIAGSHSSPADVDPSTIRYNGAAYRYLPLPADILGVDAVRLPPDGRVPVYQTGDVVLVLHSAETAPQTVIDDDTVDCGRTRLAWVKVLDASGATVPGDRYTIDRPAGTVTVTDTTDLPQPLVVRHTVADLRMIVDAQITGRLTLNRALTHDYPADESLVASCLLIGDRRARVSGTWDQVTWDGVWQDSIRGSAATGTLNLTDFPVEVTNEGCDTDRWLLRVVNASTNAWELISEQRGLVWSGTFAPGADIAPINPRTRTPVGDGTYTGGVPYLVIHGDANGGGWATGNCVRINTVGAIADFQIARSIQQSDEPDGDGADGCEIMALGNIDRP